MSTRVLAPLGGRLLAITEVPDPVFAAEMVGPGVAVDPGDEVRLLWCRPSPARW